MILDIVCDSNSGYSVLNCEWTFSLFAFEFNSKEDGLNVCPE